MTTTNYLCFTPRHGDRKPTFDGIHGPFHDFITMDLAICSPSPSYCWLLPATDVTTADIYDFAHNQPGAVEVMYEIRERWAKLAPKMLKWARQDWPLLARYEKELRREFPELDWGDEPEEEIPF